jgi:hypothetical protein
MQGGVQNEGEHQPEKSARTPEKNHIESATEHAEARPGTDPDLEDPQQCDGERSPEPGVLGRVVPEEPTPDRAQRESKRRQQDQPSEEDERDGGVGVQKVHKSPSIRLPCPAYAAL